MNLHFMRLNWLPPFLWRYPEVETPPGMVRRFWAPMARIGTGQHTSEDDMVLPGERRGGCCYYHYIIVWQITPTQMNSCWQSAKNTILLCNVFIAKVKAGRSRYMWEYVCGFVELAEGQVLNVWMNSMVRPSIVHPHESHKVESKVFKPPCFIQQVLLCGHSQNKE